MSKFMKHMLKIWLSPIILIFATAMCIIALQSMSCEDKTVSFDEHRYTITSGCMVRVDGNWYPLDNVRFLG